MRPTFAATLHPNPTPSTALCLAALAAACAAPTPTMNPEADRAAILAHVHSIFDAFLRRDRDTLRATHSDDWTGFLGPSTAIERGIDAYMARADASLAAFRGTGYELSDSEVALFGDVAVVYYVARYDYEDPQGTPGSLPLRSVDLYRREPGGWIQFGSHITPIPSGGPWGADR